MVKFEGAGAGIQISRLKIGMPDGEAVDVNLSADLFPYEPSMAIEFPDVDVTIRAKLVDEAGTLSAMFGNRAIIRVPLPVSFSDDKMSELLEWLESVGGSLDGDMMQFPVTVDLERKGEKHEWNKGG